MHRHSCWCPGLVLAKDKGMKMNKSLPKITQSRLYFALYVLISLATFRHSMRGFASLEGSPFWSGVSALAIDVLMILFAHSIRSHGISLSWKSAGLVAGMSITAAASIGTQLLYSVTEAQLLEVAPGAMWMEQRAVDIINLRVIVLPVLLPVLAIVAALMGENQQEETVPIGQLRDLQDRNRNLQRDLDAVHSADATTQSELADLRRVNTEHQRVLDRLCSPETTGSVSAFLRVLNEEIYTNGNAPRNRMLADALGVSEQLVRKAKSDAQVKENE